MGHLIEKSGVVPSSQRQQKTAPVACRAQLGPTNALATNTAPSAALSSARPFRAEEAPGGTAAACALLCGAAFLEVSVSSRRQPNAAKVRTTATYNRRGSTTIIC